jgi:glutamate formiminotransferase
MRSSVVSQLRHVAAAQKVRFAHSFQDTVYNRTSFYFVGEDVKSSVLSFCTEAFRAVDYSQHHGTHPALGSIDHICFSPLAGKPLEETKELAEDFGKTFAEYFDTPVFAYGAASSTQKRLRDIRKSLGYFDIVPESNQGTQIIEKLNSLVKANDLNNDYGSPIVDPAKVCQYMKMHCTLTREKIKQFL